MQGELHKWMVSACKIELNIPTVSAEQMVHLPARKDLLMPDLSRGKKLALEVHVPYKSALERIRRYGYYYNHFILALPMPSKIDEVWLFDTRIGRVAKKLTIE